MSNVMKKFNWEGQPTTTLIAKVREYASAGHNIESACREISKDSEHLFTRFFDAEALSSTYHRRLKLTSQKNAGGQNTTPIKNVTTRSTGVTMSMDEMVKMVRLMNEFGITITK